MSAPGNRVVGRLAVALGLASQDRVDAALAGADADAGELGQVLVDRGVLAPADLARLRDALRVLGADPDPPECRADTQVGPYLPVRARGDAASEARRDASSPPAGAGPSLVGNDKFDSLVEIGRGGMGIVYRARQRGLDRMVALKVLSGDGQSLPEQVERFHREAHAAARLQHPGIVEIHDVGEMAGRPYIAMEFVDGDRMDEYIRRNGSDLRTRLDLLRQVAEAVDHAHRHGVVHRDLKPANVMVDRRGRPKVADFGLAKELSGDARDKLTVSGMVLGTPHYMSPEQAAGDPSVDARTDVYSLGAMLYELLCGRTPHVADNVVGVLMLVLSDEIVPPRRFNPKVHLDLETIAMRALARERERRYPTARAFAEDLRRFLDGEPIEARPPTLWVRARKTVRRHRALTASMLLVVLAPIATLVQRRVEAARSRAETHRQSELRVTEGKALAQKAADLFAEGQFERAAERWRDAESVFATALGLNPEDEAARLALRDARRTRLLGAARIRLDLSAYGDAGEWLREAESVDPGHPEIARLRRVQLGTARLHLAWEAPGATAWFLPQDPPLPWLAEVLPPLERTRAAEMLQPIGPVPHGPADFPLGDGMLVLAGPAGTVEAQYLHVPRNAELRLERLTVRVDPAGRGDFRTVAEAAAAAMPGTTIEVAQGEYPEPVRISRPNVILRAAPGARPVLGGGDGPALSVSGGPGVRVQGFLVRAGSGPVVVVESSPGAAILDNEIRGGSGTALGLSGCPQAVVCGNLVWECKEPGISLSGCDFAAVVGNRVHHVGWTGIFVNGKGVTVAGNLVHDNARGGIMTHHSEGILFAENVVFNHKEWGIIAGEGSSRITIRDNVIWNIDPGQEELAGRAIQLAGSPNGRIVHNTVVACRVGIIVTQSGGTPCTDNIIVGAARGIHWHEGGVVDYNCLWRNTVYGRWIEKDARTREELRSFYSWQGEHGLEHGVEDDPRFTDLAQADFSLAADSPCRNAASDGSEIGARWARVAEVRQGGMDWQPRLSRMIVERIREEAAQSEGDRCVYLARRGLALDPEDPELQRLAAREKKK